MESLSRYSISSLPCEVRASPFAVLIKSSPASRESWSGKLPTSVYSPGNKNWMGPAFPSNLTGSVVHGVEAGRKHGKMRIVPFSPATAQRKGLHRPLRWNWVLRQQTQPVSWNRDTCELAGGDTSWKCNYSEDQGGLVRQCPLSSPCQYPFSTAAASGDSLTSLFPLAWSQLLKRCDYPSPLALFFVEEFWHHLSPHQLCFPQFSDL